MSSPIFSACRYNFLLLNNRQGWEKSHNTSYLRVPEDLFLAESDADEFAESRFFRFRPHRNLDGYDFGLFKYSANKKMGIWCFYVTSKELTIITNRQGQLVCHRRFTGSSLSAVNANHHRIPSQAPPSRPSISNGGNMPFKLCFGFSTRGERRARVFFLFICSSIVKKVETLGSIAYKIEA